MRAIFSILGLLLVVAVIGMLVKTQLGSAHRQAPTSGEPGVTLPVTTPGATPQQQKQQIEQQVRQSIDAAMQQARPASDVK